MFHCPNHGIGQRIDIKFAAELKCQDTTKVSLVGIYNVRVSAPALVSCGSFH